MAVKLEDYEKIRYLEFFFCIGFQNYSDFPLYSSISYRAEGYGVGVNILQSK